MRSDYRIKVALASSARSFVLRRTNTVKGISILAALTVIAGPAISQSLGVPNGQKFVEKPGVLEFSGELIVRPLQFDALRARGFSALESMGRLQRARQRVQSQMVQYLKNTDDIIVKIPAGFDENSYSKALMATGDYQYAEPNWICHPVLVPNDTYYNNQWAWPKISAPTAWDINQGSTSVIVSNCDTGVQHSHPDLAASLVPGYNAASNLSEQQGGSTEDINGHGTHTAGTMAAIGNNGLGVCGATWRCKIMPIRVTNNSNGSASLGDLLEGAQWAVDHGAEAINCSYSGVTSSAVETTGQYIENAGGEYCWAAGNDGTQLPSNTDWQHVTIVGASTSTDGRASFSNYGIPIDVFAPGVSILSTYPTSSYAYADGTSMASPHATGSFGLLASINPNASPSQLETFLYTTCFDMGGGGNDNTYGWGRINLGAAAQMANSNNGAHINPTAYRFAAGQYISGDVNSLANGDDNWLRGHGSLNAYIAESPIILEVDMTSPSATVSVLKLNFEAHNTQNMMIKLRLKRWSDNTWVEVDSRLYGTTDGAVQINVPSPQQYVRSGDNFIQARAAVKLGPLGGAPAFDSFFDVFNADITP